MTAEIPTLKTVIPTLTIVIPTKTAVTPTLVVTPMPTVLESDCNCVINTGTVTHQQH